MQRLIFAKKGKEDLFLVYFCRQMKQFMNTKLGRFRAVAFLEGVSLIVLVFVGMPLKYLWEQEILVKTIGPVHGVLFILYVIMALSLSNDLNWKRNTTALVLIASFIPFGTFYADRKVLSVAAEQE